jgi:transcriptional regulator with XRE-family HTH domain
VELAAELGTTQRMIAYYESRAEKAPAALLPKMAAALGVSADELLGIKPLGKGRKPDTQLQRRLQRIEKLDPKARRQITQLQEERAFFVALGARIAQLRKSANITQVQLAEELGVSQQTVNAYEMGHRRMAISALPRLASSSGYRSKSSSASPPAPVSADPRRNCNRRSSG